MKISRGYGRRIDHVDLSVPMPIIDIGVSSPAGIREEIIPLKAIVDSGSSLSLIPAEIIRDLRLEWADHKVTHGYKGSSKEAVYSAVISIDGLGKFYARVMNSYESYALIGVDLMRSLIVKLDGPTETLEIERI